MNLLFTEKGRVVAKESASTREELSGILRCYLPITITKREDGEMFLYIKGEELSMSYNHEWTENEAIVDGFQCGYFTPLLKKYGYIVYRLKD